jgi:hypothetical protein
MVCLGWPPNMMAPYQVMLHDGRLIFAPQDTDNVIKLRPPRLADDPSPPSPDMDELWARQEADDGEYDDDDEEGDGDGDGMQEDEN